MQYLVNYPDALIPAYYDYEMEGALEVKGLSKEDIVIDILLEQQPAKAAKSSITDTNKIYTQSLSQEIPEKLRVAMKSNPDVETIKQSHPEVWQQYIELCKRINSVDRFGNPPGACTSQQQKCCITSGYRHPAYNQEIGGARNSPHQYGLAIDVYAGPLKEQLRLVEANEKPTRLFTRVAVYPDSTHVHFDLMPLKGEYAVAYMALSKKSGKTIATASSFAELENKAIT